MISMLSVFWIMLALFATIGMLRGWAKEIIATAGIVLALFALTQFGDIFPARPEFGADTTQLQSEFAVRMIFFLGVVFFAYQTPAAAALWEARQGASNSARRFEWLSTGLQQRILGFIIGLINGWLVAGSVWWYAHDLQYPFGEYVIPPSRLNQVMMALGYTDTRLQQTTTSMIDALPLAVLKADSIVLPLLVVILFLFVIVVMI